MIKLICHFIELQNDLLRYYYLMTLLLRIIVVNLSPFTKPTILQWPVCEEIKGYQGKEHDIIRLVHFCVLFVPKIRIFLKEKQQVFNGKSVIISAGFWFKKL